MMRFFRDLKRYRQYILYSARQTLKAEVASSYLSWLWWFLDPLLLMLVYTFISKYVFTSRPANFPLYVMIGLTVWAFFNKSVISCTDLVRANKGLVVRINVPKFVLVLAHMQTYAAKMLFSFLIVVGMLIAYAVPLTWAVFNLIPLFLTLYLFTFGCGMLFMHVGVYFQDIRNLTAVGLRLVMYLSGVFYSITRSMPEDLARTLMIVNPLAFLMEGVRTSLSAEPSLDYLHLLLLFLASLALDVLGVWVVYRHENEYAKLI